MPRTSGPDGNPIEELALRASECEAFELMVGMPVRPIDNPDRVGFVMAMSGGDSKLIDWLDGDSSIGPQRVVLALRHVGAGGYLLALVRRAWRDHTISTRALPPSLVVGQWIAESSVTCGVGRGASELESLVDALERAPKPGR